MFSVIVITRTFRIMRLTSVRALTALVLLSAAACSVDKVAAPVPVISETVFAPALGVNLAEMTVSNSGLYMKDLVVGTGDSVVVGSAVTVNYTGWIPSGSQFDSSVGRNPLTTAIGVGAMIRGWDEGLIGMKTGGKRRLIIPPSLGYGNRAQDRIPSNSILVFDVELVKVQ